ncbi:MAG: hypothetical protein P4L69_24275 [Desulfosporosinus sp.]|nr:hypothetical protein [Desulfosporosinus sp.]
MDLPAYAEKNIVPRFEEALKDFVNKQEKLQEPARAFSSTFPGVKKNLLMLKDKVEKLLGEINKALASLERCDPDYPYAAIKATLEQQLSELETSVAQDNMKCIIKAIESQKELQRNMPAEIGDAELKLIEGINSAVTQLLGTKELTALGECLHRLAATCKNVFKRITIPAVTNRFVYGICNPIGECKNLCRYDIGTYKIGSCAVAVPHYSTILQTGKRVFISGGGSNPVVNTFSEFIAETKGLVNKAPMNYAKSFHAMVAVSPTQFMTIGGYCGGPSMAYCEEYSIEQNTWKVMPSLNQGRQGACAALSGDCGYLYAIGGTASYDIIERLDMDEKKVWEKVDLSGAAEVLLSKYLAVFPISTDEIMILAGNSSADCGIFNAKTKTVKKYTQSIKADSYYGNSVCMIDGDAYIMGSSYANVYIYRSASKKIQEIDYHDAPK